MKTPESDSQANTNGTRWGNITVRHLSVGIKRLDETRRIRNNLRYSKAYTILHQHTLEHFLKFFSSVPTSFYYLQIPLQC